MSKQPRPPLSEARLRETARSFAYPPTPDIAGQVRRRLDAHVQAAPRSVARSRARLLWVGLAVLLLLFIIALVAVPQVQALARALLRLGAVEIVVPTPTTTPLTGLVATTTPRPVILSSGNPTSVPSPTPLVPAPQPTDPNPDASLAALAGETTLADARQRVNYPIALPAFPPDLGQPARVFLQDLDEPVVILAWTSPTNPDRARMSLWLLPTDALAQKTVQDVATLQETTVGGKRALWITGPHVLRLKAAGAQPRWGAARLVDGKVLVWQDGGLTYRLESNLELAQAVTIAESLR